MAKKGNKVSNLGIDENIDGVTIDDIIQNRTALKMLLHNYKKINSENEMLKQDLERQATFERSLEKKNGDSKLAGMLSLFSSVTVGFGINFITNNIKSFPSWIVLVVGIILQVMSIYLSVRKEPKDV